MLDHWKPYCVRIEALQKQAQALREEMNAKQLELAYQLAQVHKDLEYLDYYFKPKVK